MIPLKYLIFVSIFGSWFFQYAEAAPSDGKMHINKPHSIK